MATINGTIPLRGVSNGHVMLYSNISTLGVPVISLALHWRVSSVILYFSFGHQYYRLRVTEYGEERTWI